MLSGDDLTIVLFLFATAISIGGTAVSATGWRHPAVIGSMFALAGVFIALGAGWPFIKTTSPAITEMTRQVATNPIAWFVVLILGMIASIMLPRRRVVARGVKQTAPHASPSATPKQKVLVDVSPIYLMDLYEGKTTLQGDALVAGYIGKWIITTFPITDIQDGDKNIIVQGILDKALPFKWISAWFAHGSTDDIVLVAKDALVTVRGEILMVDSQRVTLWKCELVPAA